MNTPTKIELCGADEVAPGEAKRVEKDGLAVAVFNLDGQFYVTDDACTHGESSLSEMGELNGEVVECGRHFGGFHVPTGNAVLAPCSVALRTYPVVERDGALFVEVG